MFKRSTFARRATKRRRLAAEPLEARRLLAASLGWDGPGLGSAELTYTIRNAPSSLSQAEVSAAIDTAFDAWASVVDITFTQVNQTGLRDSIDISFTNIDGSGRTLAQAYFPDDVNPARIAGDIQFDSSEIWEVGNSRGNRAFDLVWVAAHEIGHSLGLDHLPEFGSVLQAFVSPNQSFAGLSTSDVTAIRRLYAAADDGVTPETPIVETPIAETPVAETPTADTPDNDPSDTGDTDDNPFPRWRWRRGGHWWRWGGRVGADVPEDHNVHDPTDTNEDGSTSAVDALWVINQLKHNAQSTAGLCDVNGDGNISSLDALMVINSLLESATTSQTVDVTDQQDTAENEWIADDDGTLAEADDDQAVDTQSVDHDVDDDMGVEDDSIDTDIENDTASDTENTDSVDGTDAPAGEGETDPSNETEPDETDSEESDDDDENQLDDAPAEPVDEGGLTDEEDDRDSHHHRRFGFGRDHFVRAEGEHLFDRFDDNEDGGLTADELPEQVWERLVDKNIDADADGSITRAEFQAYASARRAERFAQKDDNGDGLLTEDEVSSRFWAKVSPADSNGDGVSWEELETWLEQRSTESPAAIEPAPASRGFDRAFAQLGRQFGRGRR